MGEPAVAVRRASVLAALALGAAVVLLVVRAVWFLNVSGDDAYFIDFARHLLNGRIAVDVYGDLAGHARVTLSYPPLHPALLALAFSAFGVSYEAAKLVSAVFFAATVALCFLFLRRTIGAWEGLIVALLLMFDPLFFGQAGSNRPEMTAAFFFTAGVLASLTAERQGRTRWFLGAGALAGLACLSSHNSAWLVMGAVLYHIGSGQWLSRPRRILAYLAAWAAVVAPYYLWILLSPERTAILMGQVAFASSLSRGVSLQTVGKALLNPLADCYLMLARYHSIYPFIWAAVVVFLVTRRRELRSLLWILAVAMAMMMVNERAGRYLLLTMPFVYVAAGYLLRDLGPIRAPLAVAGTALLIGNGVLAVRTSIARPDLPMDRRYYQDVLERHTRPGSRIATDMAFLLSASGGRQLVSLSCLIWDRWRLFHSYDAIVSSLRPDYVLLTDRKKGWAEDDHPQAADFQRFLGEECRFIARLPAYGHGALWLYERIR